MESVLSVVIVGAVAGGGGVLLITWLLPRPNCSACSEPMPKFRKPTNWRQALFGGSTCVECGREVDSKGRLRN